MTLAARDRFYPFFSRRCQEAGPTRTTQQGGSWTTGGGLWFTSTGVVEGVQVYSTWTAPRTVRASLWAPGGTRVYKDQVIASGEQLTNILFDTPFTVDADAIRAQDESLGYAGIYIITIHETSGAYYLRNLPGAAQLPNVQDSMLRLARLYGVYAWVRAGDNWPGDGSGFVGSYAPIDLIGYSTGEESLPDPGARVALPAASLDLVTTGAPVERIVLINCYPEDEEDNVKVDAVLQGTVSSLDNIALAATTKLYVSINGGAEELAYDQGGTGFQAGWDGSGSSATVQQSPGSGVNDELVYTIDRTTDYPSQASVTVRVEAGTV